MRSRWHLTAAVLVAAGLVLPATAAADPSFGPFLSRDITVSEGGRTAAAVGFTPSESLYGPLGYLVVWSETRDPATGADIYGQGFTARGEFYGVPFVISAAPGNQDHPVLVHDGLRFVVVWHDQPTDSLVARQVHLEGPSRGGPVVIATHAGRAAIASDGQAWNRTPSRGIVLVVWESRDYYPGSQGDISGQFFDIGFNGAITPGLSISGYHSLAHESAPAVAYGADRYLVTWNTEPVVNDDAHRDIQGVVMTADGTTAWGEFPITTAPSWQHNGAGNIAFNGTDFLVAWDDHRAGGFVEDVYAARVTPAGVLLDGPPDTGGIAVSLAAGDGLPHAPRVAAVEDGWLVVWAGTRARGARLGADGVVRDADGPALSVGGAPQWFPGVASDGRSAMVTWVRGGEGLEAQLVGTRPESVDDLVAEVETLVALGRLTSERGARLVQLALSGALDAFVRRVWDIYTVRGYLPFVDGTTLMLQARWLMPPALDTRADLGDTFDEWQHALSGWGAPNPGPLPIELGDPDRTSRYQLLRGANGLTLDVAQPGLPHVLAFRTEDGICDDSFDVDVNGTPVYVYRALSLPETIFPVHKLTVPGTLLDGERARITFQNRAADSCGLAAVYFVTLVPVAEKPR